MESPTTTTARPQTNGLSPNGPAAAITTGTMKARYPAMLVIITRTKAAATHNASIRMSGESCKVSAPLTKVSANQDAAPVITRAWANDRDVATTMNTLQPSSRSRSRHDNRPMPGMRMAHMAIRAGIAGCSPWAKSVNQRRAVHVAIAAAFFSAHVTGPSIGNSKLDVGATLNPDL